MNLFWHGSNYSVSFLPSRCNGIIQRHFDIVAFKSVVVKWHGLLGTSSRAQSLHALGLHVACVSPRPLQTSCKAHLHHQARCWAKAGSSIGPQAATRSVLAEFGQREGSGRRRKGRAGQGKRNGAGTGQREGYPHAGWPGVGEESGSGHYTRS